MLVTFLNKWHLIYFGRISCFSLYFQWSFLDYFTSRSLNPNQSPAPVIMVKTFERVNFLSWDPGREQKCLFWLLSLRNRLREVDCLAQRCAGGNIRARFVTQSAILPGQRAPPLPVSKRLAPLPGLSSVGPGPCLVNFQSAVRVQQPSQNVSISTFCACQQLPFLFHSVTSFQVLYSILWRMTHRDSFTLWEKSWEEKFLVYYVTQRDLSQAVKQAAGIKSVLGWMGN